MVVGQRCAVRLHICNVTRPRMDMSRMNTQSAPSLFVPEPKRSNIRQACRSGKGWRFFPLYGCGKNLHPLPDCLDRLCLAGYNQSGDGRAICLILFRSHPARRRGYGPASQTCSVQVDREKCNQSGNRPSYIIDNSPKILPQLWICMVHFFVASKVDRYSAFNRAVSLGNTLRCRFSFR